MSDAQRASQHRSETNLSVLAPRYQSLENDATTPVRNSGSISCKRCPIRCLGTVEVRITLFDSKDQVAQRRPDVLIIDLSFLKAFFSLHES